MQQIILISFLAVLGLFCFYAGLTIYSLLRFGQSRMLATMASAVFLILILILVINAFVNINSY